MLANWVRETTATTGTGTITLAGAVSGFVAFSAAYSDGDLVPYVVEDGTNRERGLGTFTASGTTLARTLVLETLVSGTLDKSAPTAISLSGSATVAVAPSNDTAYPVPPGAKDFSYLNSAHWILTSGGQSSTYTANRQYATPFLLLHPMRVTDIRIRVLTAQAGSAGRVGLSRMDQNGEPVDGYLAEGSVDTTTTGNKAHNFTAVDLLPGWYFLHWVTDNASVALQSFGTTSYIAWHPIKLINQTDRATPSPYLYADIGAWTVLASASTIVNSNFQGYIPHMHLGGSRV